jgi:hypothetical protein
MWKTCSLRIVLLLLKLWKWRSTSLVAIPEHGIPVHLSPRGRRLLICTNRNAARQNKTLSSSSNQLSAILTRATSGPLLNRLRLQVVNCHCTRIISLCDETFYKQKCDFQSKLYRIYKQLFCFDAIFYQYIERTTLEKRTLFIRTC